LITNYALTIPTLETERLVLRGWKEADAAGYAELYGDEDNAKFIGGVMAPWDAWRMVAQRIGQWHCAGSPCLPLNTKSPGQLSAMRPQLSRRLAGARDRLGADQALQGKGYASEAARASLRFAYEVLGWRTAISLIDTDNTPSRKLAERLGATFERTETVTSFTADIYRHLPPSQFLK
jgi:RimJ/RimL family protein N-acetyltransferase